MGVAPQKSQRAVGVPPSSRQQTADGQQPADEPHRSRRTGADAAPPESHGRHNGSGLGSPPSSHGRRQTANSPDTRATVQTHRRRCRPTRIPWPSQRQRGPGGRPPAVTADGRRQTAHSPDSEPHRSRRTGADAAPPESHGRHNGSGGLGVAPQKSQHRSRHEH